MSTTSKIAWRNIWRNKRRTLLTLVAITFCTGILVFFMALQFSMYDTTIKATISTFQGAMQIQREGYLDKPEMRKSFVPTQDLTRFLKQSGQIKAVAPRALGFALISSKDRTYGVQIVGIDPEREGAVSTIPSLVKQGQYLAAGDDNQVVVGKALAQNLKVSVGDEVTLLGQGRDGSLAATVLEVKGVFESGVQDLDRGLIAIPLATFQDVFSMGDHIHALVLASDEYRTLDDYREVLSGKLPSLGQRDLAVLTWSELMPGIKQAIEFDMTFGWLFYLSLVLIVSLSVLNTFLMAVLERTREFGLMMALGMKPLVISRLIIFECLLLTSLGVLIGIVIGGSVIYYFNVNGFYLPGSDEIMKLWNVPVEAHPWFSVAALTLGPAVMLASTLLTVLYPALRICKLQAVEAMRAT